MNLVFGFDFGTKYIGVAIGQMLSKTARPLTTIVRKNKQHDWQQISKLIQTWQPSALVVGKPLILEGQQQELTELATKFARQLQGRFNLPVYEEDERLTSREAQAIIRNMNLKGEKKLLGDKLAAQVILQSWINNNPELGS